MFTVARKRRESLCAHAALISVACVLSATRKICGFLNHNAKFRCSKRLKSFGTDTLGKITTQGFSRVYGNIIYNHIQPFEFFLL